jgi:hypothetical protein
VQKAGPAQHIGFEVYSISPEKCVAGDAVTLKGKLFGDGKGLILVDGKPAKVSAWSDKLVIFTAPGKPGKKIVQKIVQLRAKGQSRAAPAGVIKVAVAGTPIDPDSRAYDLLLKANKTDDEAESASLLKKAAEAANPGTVQGRLIKAIAMFQQNPDEPSDIAKALTNAAAPSVRTPREKALAFIAQSYMGKPTSNLKKAVNTDPSCELAEKLLEDRLAD